MAKFLVGVILGMAMSWGYVRFGIEPPDWLALPDRLRGNLVSTATEPELYDLDVNAASRQRALEVYFSNRPADAAKTDAAAGHPFLSALHRQRAVHEARLLNSEWQAYGMALGKSELRAALERRYAVTDDQVLKQKMLADSLDKRPFLKQWLTRNDSSSGDLLPALQRLSTSPATQTPN